MTRVLFAAAVVVVLGLASGAWANGAGANGAGQVLDRVRRDGVVRCSAAERPAVAMPRPDGGNDGLAIDLCRAVAVAVLGRGGRVAFTIEDEPRDSDVAFVAGGTTHETFVTGPVVFVDRLAVLVPRASPVHVPRDLAGETVCLMIGSPEQRALETVVHRLGIGIVRLAFEEDDEMRDAYAVGRCGAMAGDATELEEQRAATGINRVTSRVLSEPLAVVPIVAATSAADRSWSALVFWLMRDLRNGSGGIAPAGLRRGWREDLRAMRSAPGTTSPAAKSPDE